MVSRPAVSHYSLLSSPHPGEPSAARLTSRIVGLYPPSTLVLEIIATGYTSITWLVNGTAMHDFTRLSFENDKKRLLLINTTANDIAVYEADVHLNNGTLVPLDFIVSLYCKLLFFSCLNIVLSCLLLFIIIQNSLSTRAASPDVVIGEPAINDDDVTVTCMVMGNPLPSSITLTCDKLDTSSSTTSVNEGSLETLSVSMASITVNISSATGLQECTCEVSSFNGQMTVITNDSIILLACKCIKSVIWVTMYFLPHTFRIAVPSEPEINSVSTTIIAPNMIELVCISSSRPVPDIQWLSNGNILNPSSFIGK